MTVRTNLTAEVVRKAIEDGRPTSMTKLAHLLGRKGSVSGSLTKRLRALVPEIDKLLKGDARTVVSEADNPASVGKAKKQPKPAAENWPRHPRNPFREGSYGTCFDILAAHPGGLRRDLLVELLAQATGKDYRHAGYDAQVVCSASGAAGEDLNPFEGPRNRSCRFGFWVKRENSHLQLVLPNSGAAQATP
jgi:hypothetical protein